MEVILLKDVENLGIAGDVVQVKPGYARNFLVPRGLALRASKQNLAVAEERRRVINAKVGRAQKVYINLAKSIEKQELTIEVEVGEEQGRHEVGHPHGAPRVPAGGGVGHADRVLTDGVRCGADLFSLLVCERHVVCPQEFLDSTSLRALAARPGPSRP